MPRALILIALALSGCTPAGVMSGTSSGTTVMLDLSIGSYDDADKVAQTHCARFGKTAKRLYVDEVSVIVSAATDGGEARLALIGLAREVLAMTDQLAVFVSVGGIAEIIE